MINRRTDKAETINIEEEFSHILDYLEAHWNGFSKESHPHNRKALLSCFNACLEETKNSFNESAIFCSLIDACDYRPLSSFYDIKKEKLNSAIRDISFNLIKVKKDFYKDWSFEKFTNNVIEIFKNNSGNPKDIKPNGWFKAIRTYNEDVEYVEPQPPYFKGEDSGTASAPGFEKRISLANALYDHKEQGSPPMVCLMGAIIAHCDFLNTHNNLANVELNIKKMETSIQNYYDGVVLEAPNIGDLITHPILKMAHEKSEDIKDEKKQKMKI